MIAILGLALIGLTCFAESLSGGSGMSGADHIAWDVAGTVAFIIMIRLVRRMVRGSG